MWNIQKYSHTSLIYYNYYIWIRVPFAPVVAVAVWVFLMYSCVQRVRPPPAAHTWQHYWATLKCECDRRIYFIIREWYEIVVFPIFSRPAIMLCEQVLYVEIWVCMVKRTRIKLRGCTQYHIRFSRRAPALSFFYLIFKLFVDTSRAHVGIMIK